MRFIVTVLYLMFFVGMVTNHIGAGLIAFAAASFFVWAESAMEYKEEACRAEDYYDELAELTDDDVDPRIKS